MKGQYTQFSTRRVIPLIFFLSALVVVSSGCGHKEPTVLNLGVKEQHVPVTVGIGPFNVSQLTHNGEPIDEEFGEVLNKSFLATLDKTNIFKKVFIIDTKDLPTQDWDSESVRLAAQRQGADLILVGEVKNFAVKTPGILDGMDYQLDIVLSGEMYHVLSRKHIWRKSDFIEVSREGFITTGEGELESIKDILRSVVVRSSTAGLMGPLVAEIQNEYKEFDPESERNNRFGDAAMAWIDEELLPPQVLRAPNPHAYAVVIGIEEYQRFPKVEYAFRDSEKIKTYLTNSMGYLEKNIALLNDRDASRSQVGARIEKWLPSRVAGNPEAEVFVYFGGHGTYDINTNRAYLVPHDGDLTYVEETTYSLERLYEQLGTLPAKQVTVVLDSCFSGVGGRSIIRKNARANLSSMKTTRVTSDNLIVFTASDAKEISSGYMEKRHGLFTYFFLRGLQGQADSDNDGKISIQEQYTWVKDQVETEARKDNRDQTPQLLASQGHEHRFDSTLRGPVNPKLSAELMTP